MQRDQTLEVVGELRPMLRLAAAEGIAGDVVGVANMIHACEQSSEHLTIVGDAADRRAAEIDAVIAALAADQPGLCSIALGPVIGERDLERGLDRFGARVGEEHMVEARRRDIDELRGTFERACVAHLEGSGEIELANLLADGLDDPRPAMSGVNAPQP